MTPADGIQVGTPWGGMRPLQQSQAALNFSPAGKCPVYEQPADVVAEVKAKQQQDDQQMAATRLRTSRSRRSRPAATAECTRRSWPSSSRSEVREPDGTLRYVVDENAAKKLGSYVNPPIET